MNNSIKKCSKCNVEYDQNLGSIYSVEVGKQRRIFTKNGKHFCFSCLASECNVNCRLCHKRINSKDELAYWGGVISVNGSYELDPNPDFFDFRCRYCGDKEFDTNKPIEDQINPKNCRIAGCSQNSYYSSFEQNFCKYHSKPCQGTHEGKRCDAAIGSDEGDFCKFCKNQTETYQQRKDGLETESSQESEKFRQVYEKAQKYWDALSSFEREKECEKLVNNMKLGKYRGEIRGEEGEACFWAPNGSCWIIENGKLVSSSPQLVPAVLVEEFLEKEFGGNVSKDLMDKYSPKPNPASSSSQSITSENSKNDNSVNPGDSSKLNSGKDSPSEEKNNVKSIKFENNSSENSLTNPASEKSPNKTDNEVLIINLKNVKQITRTAEGNLVIEFSSKQENNSSMFQTISITPNQINNNRELQKINNYLDKNNRNSLTQQELTNLLQTKKNNKHSLSRDKSPQNHQNLWIGLGIGGTLIIGVIAGLLIKRDKGRKKIK